MIIADFHSHILPRMDDGSRSVAESVQMLKMGQEQGIEYIVATPHFYPHNETPDKFLARREIAANALQGELAEALPQVILGAEVYYFPGMSESESLKELTIHGGKYILVEMPMTVWSDRMLQELEDIHAKQGLTPVVAHVDRYLVFWRNRKLLERLAQMPVLVQANASFFLRCGTAKRAMKMLKKGQIQLLGSDCHNLKDRPQNLGKAVERIERMLGAETLERIGYYQSLVSGKNL